MKNKVFKLVTMSLVCVMLFAMPVFANERRTTPSPDSAVSSVGIRKSTSQVLKNTRGTYFSVATITMDNPRAGVLTVDADVICSEEVDKIVMKLYLDVYRNGSWSQVKSWTSTTLNEVVAAESFEYTNAVAGSTYQIRSNYAVYKGNYKETATGVTKEYTCEQ